MGIWTSSRDQWASLLTSNQAFFKRPNLQQWIRIGQVGWLIRGDESKFWNVTFFVRRCSRLIGKDSCWERSGSRHRAFPERGGMDLTLSVNFVGKLDTLMKEFNYKLRWLWRNFSACFRLARRLWIQIGNDQFHLDTEEGFWSYEFVENWRVTF